MDVSMDMSMGISMDVSMDIPVDISMDISLDISMDTSRDISMDISMAISMDMGCHVERTYVMGRCHVAATIEPPAGAKFRPSTKLVSYSDSRHSILILDFRSKFEFGSIRF